jgi:ubiquitin C-terminal hydrolase
MFRNVIQERCLKNDFKSIPLETIKYILGQMEKNICKIRCKYGDYGTGFLSLIPFPDKSKLLPVLITNNHILEKNDITPGKIIEFTVNNDNSFYRIIIDKSRKTYTSEFFDIIFIEIKSNDGLPINLFLEIDDMINNVDPNEAYKGKAVYILHYPYGTKVEYSFGKIENIENNIIRHLCQTEKGSSGSPILNLFNYKVMGIHVGYTEGENWNLGLFIKEPIKEFYDNCMNNNGNNIYNYNNNYMPVGLKNVGKSSYMNAVIQCLSNIKSLSNYFLKKLLNNSYDINIHSLSISYSCILQQLFYSKEKNVNPTIFKEIIGELYPLFKVAYLADPIDFISFLIKRLHQELNSNSMNSINIPPINSAEQELQSQNENISFELFLKDFILKNKSIIIDTFYGFTRSIMKCDICKITKYSFQAFYILNFQLKKVQEKMKKELGSYYKKLNLYDAFNVMKKPQILKGGNMIYCKSCHKLTQGLFQQNIYGLPSVLIIVLNRGINHQEFIEEFEYPLILDFTNQDIIINQQSYMKYYLFGVISRFVENGKDAKYIAYCRNGHNSQFFCFNDDLVFPINEKDVLKSTISKNKSQNIIPYILFYHHL